MSLVLAGVGKGVVTGVAVGVGLGVMACLRLRRPKPESSAGYWQELGRLWSGVDKYILQGSSGVGQCAGVLSALVTHMESESARVSAQREESVGEYKKCLTQLDKANSHAKLLRKCSQECADRAHWIEWHGCLEFFANWHRVSLQSAYRIWQRGVTNTPMEVYQESTFWKVHEPAGVLEEARSLCDPVHRQGGEWRLRLTKLCSKWDFVLYNLYASDPEFASAYTREAVESWSEEKARVVQEWGAKAQEFRRKLIQCSGFQGVPEGDASMREFVEEWEDKMGVQHEGWPICPAFEELKVPRPA